MKIAQDRRHPADVVRVAVAEGDRVQMAQPALPQIGRNHVLANIQLAVAHPQQSAGVQQQRAAVRRDHQKRVALSNVDGGNFQLVRLVLKAARMREHKPRRSASSASEATASTRCRRASSSASA